MIEINLLPVREARRRADLRQQGMSLLLVLIVVGAGIGYAQSRVTAQIESAQRRIRQMELDIQQFQPQLDQVAAFRKKKANLEKKIDIIDGLDRARKGRVLDELSIHTPERLWLTNLSTNGGKLELKGESLDNELVAVLLHGLGESEYFDKVDLDSTELGEDRGGIRTVTFKLQANLVTPKSEKAKNAKGKGKGKNGAKGKATSADEAVAG